MDDLSGRTALITGGSSGIGLATARLMSEMGVSVIVLGRDGNKLEGAVRSLKGPGYALVSDVAEMGSLMRASEELREKEIRLDILVNSAGVVRPKPLIEQEWSDVERTVKTNLLGTMGSCKAFIPIMGRPGSIVNISSMAGLVGLYGYTSYGASKFGVVGFSEALSMELKRTGIAVSVVFPPDTDTPQLRREVNERPEELKRIARSARTIPPETVARSIVKAARTGKEKVFPTASCHVQYMLVRLAEPLARAYIRRKVHG